MKNLAFLIFSILLVSCGQIRRVDTAEVKQLMADFKIKKVNQEEIIEEANVIGTSISEKFNGNLNIECSDHILFEGKDIQLIDLNLLNDADLKNGKIGEILEAYKFSKDQKEIIGNNIQKVNDTLYLYSFPINPNALIYKNCKKDLGLIMLPKKALVKAIKK